jgi:hypothetical protein
LFVAAAGNDGADVDSTPAYPCAYDLPNVLCVTASDRNDGRPAFANVGARSVDLAAPGTTITGPLESGGWGYASGTSFAAPHVAGAAALLLARVPSARPQDLIAALTGSATSAPDFAGKTVSGGRLDVAAALDAVRATPWPAPPDPEPTPTPPPVVPVPPPSATPAPAPPSPAPTPVARPVEPAKLKLRRAATTHGRLDVLAQITRRAQGTVDVIYRARGRTMRLTAPISNGRIRVQQRLPRALRGDDGGIVELRWAGGDGVRAAALRLRAAARPAHLRREHATLRDGRLKVSGRISTRARGSVRLELLYGDDGVARFSARIRHGRWSLDAPVPTAARAGGYLVLQFTGDRKARLRGEQDGLSLSGA